MGTRRAESQTQALDARRIVACALQLAKKHGTAKLSLPMVASALGVPVTALQKHVGTRNELIKLLRISVLETVPGLAESEAPPARRKAPALTEAQIIETALELVRRDGADALSMRGLAKHLGVSVMGLYHHVPSKEALLERLWTTLLSRVPLARIASDDWEDELRNYAVEGVALLTQYPGLLKYGFSRPPTEVDLQFNRHGMELLRAAGFDDTSAALGTATFHMFLVGTVIIAERFRELRSNGEVSTGFEALDRSRGTDDLRGFVAFGARTWIAGMRARRGRAEQQPQLGTVRAKDARSKTPRA